MAEATQTPPSAPNLPIIKLPSGVVYRLDNGKFYKPQGGEFFATPTTPSLQAELQGAQQPAAATSPPTEVRGDVVPPGPVPVQGVPAPTAASPLTAPPPTPSPAAPPAPAEQVGSPEQPDPLAEEKAQFLQEPRPFNLTNALLGLATGPAGAVGESAAMKVLPQLGQRSLKALLGRAGVAGLSQGAVDALLSEDPLKGLLMGFTAGASGSASGSTVERGEASAKEMAGGGRSGRMATFVNKFGEMMGLGKLVDRPQEIGDVFTQERPRGINQPSAPESLFQQYSEKFYQPTLDEARGYWPQGGQSVPELNQLAADTSPENLSPGARTQYDTVQQQIAQAKAMPTNTQAQINAQAAALAGIKPPQYSMDDVLDTANGMRDRGYMITKEGVKEGIPAKVARQKAHELTDALGGYFARFHTTNPNLTQAEAEQLAQRFYDDRIKLRQIDLMTDLMLHATSGEDAGFGKLVNKYFGDKDFWREWKATFGATEPELRKVLTRGYKGDPMIEGAVDRPPSVGGGIHGMMFNPMTWHFFAHPRSPVSRMMRPEAQPFTQEQLMQTAIPTAILRRWTGGPMEERLRTDQPEEDSQ